jgi:invasion protein IalB
MTGTTRLRLAALAAAICLALPAKAQEQAAATPQTTTATYRAWTLRCDNAVGTPPATRAHLSRRDQLCRS